MVADAATRHGVLEQTRPGRADRTSHGAGSPDPGPVALPRDRKRQAVHPDARQKRLLEQAAVVGEAMAKANTTDKRVAPAFWPDTNWKHALVVSVDQRTPNYDQLDERAAWFYEAVVVSKGMLTQTPGVGQRYIAAYKDRTGAWLDGANAY